MKKLIQLTMVLLASYTCKAQTQFIDDPSFETGTPPLPCAIWNDVYNDSSGCIVAGPNFANTGNKCLAMVIAPTSPNGGSAGQIFSVLNPNLIYNAKLEFYIKNGGVCSGSSNDVFIISINNSIKNMFTLTGLKSDSATIGTSWKKFSITIDTLALGYNILNIKWGNFSGMLTSSYTGYYLDDITLTSGYATSSSNVTTNNTINVYPTIMQNSVVIENIDETCIATFFNITGQAIKTNNLNISSKQSIDINNLPQAVYFLQIKNNNGLIIKNIKVQKI